jgi:hypothetical protein
LKEGRIIDLQSWEIIFASITNHSYLINILQSNKRVRQYALAFVAVIVHQPLLDKWA